MVNWPFLLQKKVRFIFSSYFVIITGMTIESIAVLASFKKKNNAEIACVGEMFYKNCVYFHYLYH